MSFSPQDREICLQVLQQISKDPSVIDNDERMKALIAKIHLQGKKGQRKMAATQRSAQDREVHASTGMVRTQTERLQLSGFARASLPDPTQDPAPRTLHRPTSCYICKQPFSSVHWFYHLLCPQCADFNWRKRGQRTDLSGRIALLTGGRIKIGYEVALKLLRDGATVWMTTRFPHDAARRFSQEKDFGDWTSRLQIYGLDLRNLSAVEAFASHLNSTLPHLDIIIHNAAQTVKRPLEFYRHLLEVESQQVLEGPTHGIVASQQALELMENHPQYPAQLALDDYFPLGKIDADGQQFDARPTNSWKAKLDEVSTLEMVEVQIVNAIAPFVLNAQLKELLTKSPNSRRFIENVSAMEGQFNRENKTCFHPHTNMAKAALNMLTRTSAADLASEGIYMNSVDTGWITDENPYPVATNIREKHGFFTPLDSIDGAARIYDPIARGINEVGEPLFGHFLKDYAPYPW